MEKLKIVINGNEDIAEKAKEYFGFLGYHISNENRNNCYGWSLGHKEGDYYVSKLSFDEDKARLVTVDQLKDLVVLKRSDVGDATHVDRVSEPWFVSSDNKFHSWADDSWAQERENVVSNYNPKPIEKPMKEYLRKNSNGTYSYIGPVHTDHVHDLMIEIPGGAEVATLNGETLYFWKPSENQTFVDGEGWVVCGKSLCSFDEYKMNDGNKTIWQRNNQTIASTVESVNDKVKSAEMARQESKEWDLGDYDFAESDALIESNVEQSSVDSTLAERESQYGSFVGVANTTGQLMSILLNSKNGYSLPYAHQEALHMICSKMARIVNGNYNHLDSWHDIGGYSKLIENLINEHENEL